MKVEEIWKPVKYQGVNYSGLYEVSNLGRARKIKNGIVKFVCPNKGIRRSMSLTKGGKTISAPVARVILASFHGAHFTRTFVADHINNNPCDDRLCNLQAITQSENVKKDGFWKKLKESGQFTPTSQKNIRSITIRANKLYNASHLYLGKYQSSEQADAASKIARGVIRIYNIKNNDKISLEAIKAIREYRLSIGLKKVNRGWFSSTKKVIGIYRSYGMYKHVLGNYFIV